MGSESPMCEHGHPIPHIEEHDDPNISQKQLRTRMSSGVNRRANPSSFS